VEVFWSAFFCSGFGSEGAKVNQIGSDEGGEKKEEALVFAGFAGEE
jgi:hypothetical protein